MGLDYYVNERFDSSRPGFDGEELRLKSLFDSTKLFYGELGNFFNLYSAAPVYVWASGNSRCSATFMRQRSKRSAHDMCWGFAIELVTAGNAVVSSDGTEHVVRAGEAYLLHERVDKKWRTGDAGFLHKRFVQITGPLLDSILHNTKLLTVTHIKPESLPRLCYLFKKANTILTAGDRGIVQDLSMIAFSIIMELAKAVKEETYPQPVAMALDYMRAKAQKQATITNEELAEASCVSISYLSALFRKHLSVSPVTYFLKMKIELAKVMLSKTSISVKETALTLGFKDPYYFSRLFKKITKMSPREYRDR